MKVYKDFLKTLKLELRVFLKTVTEHSHPQAQHKDFPGSPVVRTLHFHFWGPRFNS